ncbi:transposase [Maritimibacter sp. HL-12]|uniref:REP-associated tyrosine transposase n=1 Tax=Maritimibacter sp. HL-12 TaxID=1162418 RepID=UPI000A0F1AC2|nr:transposase [Maritimibacter sp. HL-12]SMH40368.1 putative transposase [Maritimibacter sp. HL-12]
MSNYLRPKVRGASIFFTVALQERGSDLLTREIAALRAAVKKTRETRPFRIDGWVVMPDHMHVVWTLPEGDAGLATRWSVIKARFALSVAPGHRRASHVVRRERGVRQRRFWEHHIQDAADYAAHVHYCHINPVKHGFVARAEDWPFSSVHREIREGRWP